MLSPSSRWRERSAHSTCRLSSISRIWPDKVFPSAWASAARAFLREVDPFAVEIGQLERELMTRTGKPPQACVSSIAVRTKRAIVAAGGISDTMRVPLSETVVQACSMRDESERQGRARSDNKRTGPVFWLHAREPRWLGRSPSRSRSGKDCSDIDTDRNLATAFESDRRVRF
jgi:hypothetical protein